MEYALLPGFANHQKIGYGCALPFYYRQLHIIIHHWPTP
jgi:hypothetical protein